jgi:hypothetical protein
MTTATTPRQPAKRAKGRAHALHADPYETVVGWQLFADEYEQAVERMARALCGEWPTGGDWNFTGRADFYRKIVRAQLAQIGITAQRTERKQP